MFKVRDKESGKVRTIYATRELNSEVQFLYYNEAMKDWIWCFASWFEYMSPRILVTLVMS